MFGKSKIVWITLIVLAAGIKILSFSSNAVEKYYSTGIYPLIARLERLLFGWVPFSVGDILYALAGAGLIYGLVMLIRRLARREADASYFKAVLGNTVFVMLVVYVYFNLSWGLNYDRRGIAYQLQLDVRPYSTNDLDTLLQQVVRQINRVDSLGRQHRLLLTRHNDLFRGAVSSYGTLSSGDERFVYASPSVKASLYSY